MGDKRKLPSNRNIAFEQGEIFYFTGNPCKEGHLSPRYTSSGQCVTCTNTKATMRAKAKGEQFKENRKRRLGTVAGQRSRGAA